MRDREKNQIPDLWVSLLEVQRGSLKGRATKVESDSKQLVNVVKGGSGVPINIEVVVVDIIHLTKYMEVKFRYVKRSINNVAHCVAH
ncbi:hypothetical protein LIER_27838 [Lithospermum erythrorhizon]|uniref:RNase H type-1 domain-containing protein n=1 Tax=Lithospermum erythrorhizon TaxID=34254 RepID=A0AAV3RDG3_LITER